jgi:hypothetical protein
MTHGLVDGPADNPVAIISPDDQISAVGVSALQQVKQLTLQSNRTAFGPWGDLTAESLKVTAGTIV